MGWYRRRPAVPLWLVILGWLGFASWWSWRPRAQDPAWLEKRRRFRAKMRDAFRVWEDEDAAEESPDA
jgi:hypothetical protein